MKKVLFALAVSAFFVACSDSSTSESDVTTDSTSTMMSSDPSMMSAPVTVDTTTNMMMDSSNMMSTDTMMKK
ncbi:MAG: hypothetical protein ABIO81_12720 [Ginsengibacter sp.]